MGILTNPKDFEDTLLDTKENLINSIKRFMNGDKLKFMKEFVLC
jgi:hypothetical protein